MTFQKILSGAVALSLAFLLLTDEKVPAEQPDAFFEEGTGKAVELVGFPGFCVSYPDQCAPSAGLYQRFHVWNVWELLKEVQKQVNDTIVYRKEDGDSWNIVPIRQGAHDRMPTSLGDCDEYAITKRYELLKRGIPSRALRLTHVKIPIHDPRLGEKKMREHLVLTIIDDDGLHVVMDMLGPVTDWKIMMAMGDKPIAWQSGTDPRKWISITQRAVTMAAKTN